MDSDLSTIGKYYPKHQTDGKTGLIFSCEEAALELPKKVSVSKLIYNLVMHL